MIYIKSNFLTKSKHVLRLLCITTNFANIYEHCIVIIIEISISISSALESDSSFLSVPVTKDIQTEISPHQETI